MADKIERYDFFVSVYKTENEDFDYLIGQEFENEDGVEEVQFIERGTGDSFEEVVNVVGDAVKRAFYYVN